MACSLICRIARNDTPTPARPFPRTRPVHGEQDRVGFARGLARCSGLRLATGAACQLLELSFGARIAEHHLVPRSCEDRPELPAHQSRADNADAHGQSSWARSLTLSK